MKEKLAYNPAEKPLNGSAVLPDTWDAVDGLGRILPGHEETGDLRENRYVGIFYWTWHCAHAKSTSPHNVTRILEKYPEALTDLNHPAWGGLQAPHHWNEPVFGYYNTVDKWVLRKHAELLANAGVDAVIFDNTNGTFTWQESYTALLETFAEARADGVKTPQISFLLPLFGGSRETNIQLENIYNDIYKPGKYRDLWFYWKGKPLMMAYPDLLDGNNPLHAEIRDFFTFRPGQPSYTVGQTRPDQWGWLSVHPQQIYRNPDGTPEQITVGVAQNHSAELGLTAMNGVNVFGRTYTSKGYDTRENAELYGANLAEQFEYALKVDPEFIFITGWNEWVAGRFPHWQGVDNAFPDQFCGGFSRDIEPTTGKLKDHYYYQMASFIRRYKGTHRRSEPASALNLRMDGPESQWDSASDYRSYPGNTKNRDADGYLTTHYTDTSGRNDLTGAKAACDGENLWFRAECAADITSPDDPMWMRLLIRTESDDPYWEGFQYILNRNEAGMLEKSAGGWSWEEVGRVCWNREGRFLTVRIPKTMLNLTGDAFTVRFKWADNNLGIDGDIMELYGHGDTAPGGRFLYRFEFDGKKTE